MIRLPTRIVALCLTAAVGLPLWGCSATPAPEAAKPSESSPPVESTSSVSAPQPSTAAPEKQLPQLWITTETGEDVDPYDGNQYYIEGTMTVCGCEDAYQRTDLPLQIRGRGNYSWHSCPKKSYRLKLERSEALLGLGEGRSKSWCLLANYVDQSLLRNRLALWLGEGLSAVQWMPKARSVSLYLNGEYHGVYLLAETIKVDEHRVDIAVDSSTESGFLLQMTHNSDEAHRFSVGGVNYDIKSELSEDSSLASEQLNAIRDAVEECYHALLSGNEGKIRELIDVDSLIDCYLIEEFSKNLDVGWDSFYLYREKGGKLTFGPVWDFDLAFGNAKSHGTSCFEGLYAAVDFGDRMHENCWFTELMTERWFRNAVSERFDSQEIRNLFASAGDFVRSELALYGEDYARNFEIWQLEQDRSPDPLKELSDFEEHALYLADWADARFSWLSDFIGSEDFLEGRLEPEL